MEYFVFHFFTDKIIILQSNNQFFSSAERFPRFALSIIKIIFRLISIFIFLLFTYFIFQLFVRANHDSSRIKIIILTILKLILFILISKKHCIKAFAGFGEIAIPKGFCYYFTLKK